MLGGASRFIASGNFGRSSAIRPPLLSAASGEGITYDYVSSIPSVLLSQATLPFACSAKRLNLNSLCALRKHHTGCTLASLAFTAFALAHLAPFEPFEG